MPEPKTYVLRCSAKEVVFQNGGSIINVGFHAETLIAFIKEHTNDKGYFNVSVGGRRNEGEHGETHYVALNTYRKEKQNEDTYRRGTQQMRQAVNNAKPITPEEQDDVPF